MEIISDQGNAVPITVLTGFLGAGKTSLSRRLVADHADLTLSISMTTRAPIWAEPNAVSFPIPLFAPVTMHTFSLILARWHRI